MNIKLYYRKDLDECEVYDKTSNESLVYIQGYSSKYPIPEGESLSTEQLIQIAVSYPEIEKAM